MLTVAIETSGLAGSIALLDADVCLGEHNLELGLRHGQTLVPAVGRLLADQGRSPADCRLIAVSIGPGSFTGLRVGVVFAKTLGYAVGCPVVGVETFLAVAENAPGDCSAIQIVEDAQRGDVFAGRYERMANGDWQAVGNIQIVSADEWQAQLQPDDVVAGPGLERTADRLAARCRVLDRTAWRAKAETIGRLGQRFIKDGISGDPFALEPLYLRRSSAEEKWDARSALPEPR
ncbi:MAG: tRNA (adenosine(37)-N6)-threonylcarbamoyltransferase complex dimerization subunit type 1 TsaB [Planctomycetaceae bacterium]